MDMIFYVFFFNFYEFLFFYDCFMILFMIFYDFLFFHLFLCVFYDFL